MSTIEPGELKQILDLHRKWVYGDADGKRAVLTDADLTRADLTDADLTYAVLTDADLTRADLTRAVLTDADLTGADLTGADLTDADLTGADLTDADLTYADLTRADLTRAVLTGADLTRAVLTGADLTRADLTDAVLTRAILTGADLTGAVLTPIRDDLWAVLSASPAEVPALRAALAEGRVDGSTYEGECACLVGTLANARRCSYDAIPGLKPASQRAAERFFIAIKRGDTPQTSQFSRIALSWVDDWLHRIRGAFAPVVEVGA